MKKIMVEGKTFRKAQIIHELITLLELDKKNWEANTEDLCMIVEGLYSEISLIDRATIELMVIKIMPSLKKIDVLVKDEGDSLTFVYEILFGLGVGELSLEDSVKEIINIKSDLNENTIISLREEVYKIIEILNVEIDSF